LESIPEGVFSSFPKFTAATLSYAAVAVQLQKQVRTLAGNAFATALPPLLSPSSAVFCFVRKNEYLYPIYYANSESTEII
jgi:hypothetical protein